MKQEKSFSKKGRWFSHLFHSDRDPVGQLSDRKHSAFIKLQHSVSVHLLQEFVIQLRIKTKINSLCDSITLIYQVFSALVFVDKNRTEV